MAWTIEFADAARKQLRKLDRSTAQSIYRYVAERIAPLDNPRDFGKALAGPLGELWRYRIGDYRVIVQLQHDRLTVLVLRVGHRRESYKKP